MDEKFNELISQFQAIGFDPDNEDLMDLEMYSGFGYVNFYGPNRISVALKFEDFELDLNGQGHTLKFFRQFSIKKPSSQIVIKHAEDEFHVELDVFVLHSNLFEAISNATESLSNVTID